VLGRGRDVRNEELDRRVLREVQKLTGGGPHTAIIAEGLALRDARTERSRASSQARADERRLSCACIAAAVAPNGREDPRVTSLPPDYDADPERWRSWAAPVDVHHAVASELVGPVLDVGCGDGRLAALLAPGVEWVGVDSSMTQLSSNPYRPVVLADMRALPFREGVFAEVAHLWCLYHLDDPAPAIDEARRVLEPAGRYCTCTAARDSDRELLPEGYPASPFDAEEAVAIVAAVFGRASASPWDGQFYALSTRAEVRAFCRHNRIPPERAEEALLPLWLTKRGVLVRAQRT
jgi:SAM-dependent methyltransferase